MPSADSENSEDELASLNSILLTASLLFILLVGYLINTQRLRHLPESGAAMILGFIIGLMVKACNSTREDYLLSFDGEVFFFVLLPPIIFEAGFSLETRIFVNNLGSITTFAVLGTLVSAIVVSTGTQWLAGSEWFGLEQTETFRSECQMFGALISATDPVATIALFGGSRYRTDPLLHSLVFGESILNDAVAIVLFSTIFHRVDPDARFLSFPVLGHFFAVSLGSFVFGILGGGAVSILYRRARYLAKFPAYEIAGLGLSAYLNFAVAQYLGLSGIVALFFFGVVQAHYNWFNLSEHSKVASTVIFRTIAVVSELSVFLYLGVVSALSIGQLHWNLSLILMEIVLVLVARAAHIYPCSFILNRFRTQKIDEKQQFMLWFAGLRGAIAFALALRIPCDDPPGSPKCKNSELFVTSTMIIVFCTTLIVGTAMEKVATGLNLVEQVSAQMLEMPMMPHTGSSDTMEAHRPQDKDEDTGSHLASHLPTRARSIWDSPRGVFYQWFASIDKGLLQPMLGGKYSEGAVEAENRNQMELGANLRLAALWAEDDPPPSSRAAIFE